MFHSLDSIQRDKDISALSTKSEKISRKKQSDQPKNSSVPKLKKKSFFNNEE